MECPYLSVTPNRKICTLMDKNGLDGELEAFDLKHYCRGNPNHCYFHRLYSVQKTVKEQPAEHKPKKVQVAFFTELSNLKLGETEISVDPNEDNSLHFKLIKKGFRFRYRVKPQLSDKQLEMANTRE